ncbi:MAG: tRNA uridine-5-carboxymethylaminomethyl(34) synthesis GTPase MnmE [Synergistaceae bacterium]|nr:tRNA uridine-5-carboxymethylaminomethyl(34) synthesis GTPase MnmE [Synergistaceae bacterium]
MQEDIIVACGTPQGYGGISIIRISGVGAVSLAEKIFVSSKGLSNVPARYMTLGKLKDTEEQIFDTVLAVRFAEGQSYTGEEMVEFHCHGGFASANHCISQLLSLGARMAVNGEFTRRAYTNGKINLLQAEAVNAMISSSSTSALKAASRALTGELTVKIQDILRDLTNFSATLEVDLDFPEESDGFLTQEEKIAACNATLAALQKLLAKCKAGRLLQNGFNIAIIGLPNVGKSSTLNALLEKDKAIVTDIPGTTRDIVEDKIIIGGIPINIIDTAGIRDTNDIVENLGVERSCKVMEDADLILYLLDVSQDANDQINFVHKYITDTSSILLLNKIDLSKKKTRLSLEILQKNFPNKKIIEISAKNNIGIDSLKNEIFEFASASNDIENAYSVSARQEECLLQTQNEIETAIKLLSAGAMPDLIITHISNARQQIANFLGIDATEDLLDTVFSKFCVGK